MTQNNQHGKGRPKRLTERKLLLMTKDEMERALKLSTKYGGSVSEVLRAGIAALEREHARTLAPR